MGNKTTDLFPSLERILERTNLNVDSLPHNLEKWQEFINRINNSFIDFEQERYLIERSMEISSREMLELNERLELSQAIAHIGYWFYNRKEKKINMSKESYRIFGLEPGLPAPSYEQLMSLVHEEDREHLEKLIDKAFDDGKDYEAEFRIFNTKDHKIYNVYSKGHPTQSPVKHKHDKREVLYVSGMIMDITDKKKAEEEVRILNQGLVSMARQAGMSEIATSVLHNIGNVLNSVNTSISLIQELVNKCQIDNLKKVSAMINEHAKDLATYFTNDDKGKLIPGYLMAFADEMINEHTAINQEIFNLNRNVQHIKDIVVMQYDISGVAGIQEKIHLPELLDHALQMSCASPEKSGIIINKQYDYTKAIFTEKAKLLQILINLIRNAKDAFQNNPQQSDKSITLTLKHTKEPDMVEIIVSDNGVGIKTENLTRIFSMGFTTKKTGHGFGLHSSAIAAHELGGSLVAKSEGEGKGASFILQLPNIVSKPDKLKLTEGDHYGKVR